MFKQVARMFLYNRIAYLIIIDNFLSMIINKNKSMIIKISILYRIEFQYRCFNVQQIIK